MQNDGKKAAFLFSGQGVQAGIVREHFKFLKNKDSEKTEKFIQKLQNCLDEINSSTDFDVISSLENVSSDCWNKTSFIQPLTYTLSVLTFELVKDNKSFNNIPFYMLGHSLGAFSALTAAGSLPFEQGCLVVSARGEFMQEESDRADKGMCVIIGLAEDKIKIICERTNSTIALKNAPTAFVVGCERNIFSQIEKEAALLGATKVIRLDTSGAFHTKAMQGAYEKFKEFFGKYSILKPQMPVVINMKGIATKDIEEIKYDCIESIIHPINWVRMIEFLKNKEVDCYIESGPGNSLSSLSKLNGVEKEKIFQAKTILE